jgi:cell division septum initiation protein DivIVA
MNGRAFVLLIILLFSAPARASTTPIWSDYEGARCISTLVDRDELETWAAEHPSIGAIAFENGYIVPDAATESDGSRRVAFFAPAAAQHTLRLVATWTRSAEGKTWSLSTAADDTLTLTPDLIAQTLRAMRHTTAATSRNPTHRDAGPAPKRSLFLTITDIAAVALFALPLLGALLWVAAEAAIRLDPWRKRVAAARRAKRLAKDTEQFSVRMEGTARQSEDSLAAAEREFRRVMNEMHNAFQEITR